MLLVVHSSRSLFFLQFITLTVYHFLTVYSYRRLLKWYGTTDCLVLKAIVESYEYSHLVTISLCSALKAAGRNTNGV